MSLVTRARPVATLALLALAGCADDPTALTAPPAAPSPALLAASRQPAPGGIPTRAQERPGTFADMSDDALWAHVAYADGQAVVGLKAPGAARGVWRGEVLVDVATVSQARQAVARHPGVTLVTADDRLPLLEVVIDGPAALRTLRRLPMVDYVEPVRARGDMPQWGATGGCGWPGVWAEPLETATTGDRYSLRFDAMGIPAAWNVLTGGRRTSGAGVTIGSIDTGISFGQEELRTGFAAGSVPTRTVRHYFLSSLGSSDDACGHGTRMAGALAAPDDGRGVVGVAWGANLVNVRHANGVANVSSSDARASVRAAGNAGARVVSMAWQSMNWWWQVSDEIRWWHRNRGVLFLAAAGTSDCGDLLDDDNVVFPAEMDEVLAVTGISYPQGGVPCGIHRGGEVDLTAYLEVPTTGRSTGDVTSIGGSSNATGVVAGIAALAWQANPGMTRDQLRARLLASGSLHPNRSSTMGFGLVNARRAVTGQ
jgi:subtilisin family serine protease